MRVRFIDTHKKTWPVNLMCQVLHVCPSGYYDWRKRPECDQSRSNQALGAEISQVFNEHKQRYGVPRIRDELKDRGHECSVNTGYLRLKRYFSGVGSWLFPPETCCALLAP